jgi:hypothetical protein
MPDGLGDRAPSPAALLHLVLVGFEHEDQRAFRVALVVAMNPDARAERDVEPELIAACRLDLAQEAESERARALRAQSARRYSSKGFARASGASVSHRSSRYCSGQTGRRFRVPCPRCDWPVSSTHACDWPVSSTHASSSRRRAA